MYIVQKHSIILGKGWNQIMPIDEELVPEDAKLEKQRIKEEKKKLKEEKKHSGRKRRSVQGRLLTVRQTLQMTVVPAALPYLW